MLSDLENRIRATLGTINPLLARLAIEAIDDGKWGNTESVDDSLDKLGYFNIFTVYLALVEWKVYEQNTFFLETDEDDCPIWNYPSTVVEEDLVQCLIKFFNCQHLNIEAPLWSFGILPLGGKPDGIDYMHIESGYPLCDNVLFQIEKPRGNDFV